ncbi:hypothetical protein G9A89_023821 [Geosiphon pyriformis]|nr:hypothetical protein G9A89_023821 [Geosiphon pyriformis]
MKNHYRVLLYTLSVGINAYNIWNFIGSVDEKTCVINYYSVTYARARCTVVCFDSAELLNAAIGTTPVLKSTYFYWSCLVLAKCAKYKNSGHILLNCITSEKLLSNNLSCKVFSDADKSRLAAIYAKYLAPVAYPVFFDGISWVKIVDIFSVPLLLICSGLLNSGSSSKMKPTSLDTNSFEERFMTLECSLASFARQISKLAKRLESLVPAVFQFSPECQLLIVNKFDGMQVFTSGLESGYLGASVVIIMNFSLAKHVCKVSEVSGWLLSIRLLFKNKLSVSILGLYAGAINKFSFVILGGNFNENDSIKCASFRRCLNLGLFNLLGESSFVKVPTWINFQSVAKLIDYVFVSSNLVNTVVSCNVADIGDYFDTDHKAVSVSLGLSGLLNMWLISLYKQANRDYWKFDFKSVSVDKWTRFKEVSADNAVMFFGNFIESEKLIDLGTIWNTIHKMMCLLAEKIFKKK